MALKRLTLPNPPDPSSSKSWQEHAMKMTSYLSTVKGQLEDLSRVISQPALQGVALGTYTQSTTIDNTLTGQELANAVCTLMQCLQNYGLTTPVTLK